MSKSVLIWGARRRTIPGSISGCCASRVLANLIKAASAILGRLDKGLPVARRRFGCRAQAGSISRRLLLYARLDSARYDDWDLAAAVDGYGRRRDVRNAIGDRQ